MEKKEYWITNSRFKWISLILILMFLILMGVIVWQGENLSKNACQICAQKQGQQVICSIMDGSNRQQIFNPDYTIVNKMQDQSLGTIYVKPSEASQFKDTSKITIVNTSQKSAITQVPTQGE